MNNKKAKELYRQANNEWVKLKPEHQKLFSVRRIYQQMKKVYKEGVPIKDISINKL